jgi:hypothetical protein
MCSAAERARRERAHHASLTSRSRVDDHGRRMNLRNVIGMFLAFVSVSCGVDERQNPVFRLKGTNDGAGWSQWGRAAPHDGQVSVKAQRPARMLASVVFDPFIPEEKKEGGGDVLIHYQSPLVDGDDVFMEVKTGSYVACSSPGSGIPAGCGSAGWNKQVWTERRFAWEGDDLVEKWRFESDWKPEPDLGALAGWEPVFHAALAGDYLVVPGAGGSVFVVRREDGAEVARVSPFEELSADVYVAGPLTVAPDGSVYYNALQLDHANPWQSDVAGAWLVKIAPDGTPSKVAFTDLVPNAPKPTDPCTGRFKTADLPWPPSPDAKPESIPCGGQRPGINIAPAIAPDGTVYTVSRGHFSGRHAFLIAAKPDLTPLWAASLRDHLSDGCGSAAMPPNGDPGGCREGAKLGVDPATNELPAGSVTDLSTASPVVAPDGTILYGAYTRHNYARGHLFQFSATGTFLAAYGFGWDVTPAIYAHDGGYSIVIKDNHYDTGSYCNVDAACPTAPEGPYDITQLDSQLQKEWSFTSVNTMSCSRDDQGQVSCMDDHPDGFEWCINAPAIDSTGRVFANGEDGVLYAIDQGGTSAESLFLNQSIGAAYTPLSIDAKGRIYAENFGTLFVVGE